jgi:threonine/homoserine/homoserine lactone efflux protein
MAGIEMFRSLLQQATAQGSRSTVLNPLGWVLAISVSAVLGCVSLHPEVWLTKLFAGFAIVILVIYLVAYIYFALTNSDALRSEKFTLSKMAIERSMTGDSLKGFAETGQGDMKTLPAAVEPTEDETQS